MKTKRKTYHGTPLTDAQWKELKFTGCVVAGDRIIRTLAFIKRGQENAHKEITKTARRLFA